MSDKDVNKILIIVLEKIVEWANDHPQAREDIISYIQAKYKYINSDTLNLIFSQIVF